MLNNVSCHGYCHEGNISASVSSNNNNNDRMGLDKRSRLVDQNFRRRLTLVRKYIISAASSGRSSSSRNCI